MLGAMGRTEGHWGQMNHRYRRFLFERGIKVENRTGNGGFTEEEVRKVVEENGKLPLAEALRCRVRYFTDGVVLGSKAFVEEVFERTRDRFGEKRKTGARAMKWGEWDGLCTIRDLRLGVVSPSGGAAA